MTLQDPDGSKARWAKGLGLLTVVTSEFLVSTGLGVGAGYLLWKKAGFPVWTMAILSFLGLCFAFYRLYLISQKDW
jgi:F0F1-type ATP synthase assembly protein I